jgi:hypothetical protein
MVNQVLTKSCGIAMTLENSRFPTVGADEDVSDSTAGAVPALG